MRYHRFYTDIPLTLNHAIALPKEASHHCINVLRYKVGADLVLFNGDGFDYKGKIISIGSKRCEIELLDKMSPNNESPQKIHLYQGIARG